jgi:hypothetical protein
MKNKSMSRYIASVCVCVKGQGGREKSEPRALFARWRGVAWRSDQQAPAAPRLNWQFVRIKRKEKQKNLYLLLLPRVAASDAFADFSYSRRAGVPFPWRVSGCQLLTCLFTRASRLMFTNVM